MPLVGESCFDSCVVADHKVIQFSILFPSNSRDDNTGRCTFATPANLCKPEHIATDIWQGLITEQWLEDGAFVVPESADQHLLDCSWDSFSRCLEDTLKKAAVKAEASFSDPEGQCLAADRQTVRAPKCWKGQVLFQNTRVFQGSCKPPESTFRERSLQKVVFRLSEMIRLERLDQRQSRAYDELASSARQGDAEQKLRTAPGLLETLRASQDKKRHADWKARMRRSTTECYRWLKTAPTVPNFCIRSSSVPNFQFKRTPLPAATFDSPLAPAVTPQV